ncbi:M67 family metallopeptidase [Fuchsiella alkaliacetigena]|uniref:M67 family metallopeptidase n=1 Tax=Fuchsiella alkaliacetigena TaxID=957042 RepID=UPI00200A9198|nr:M67 family metallopeptidase [Fuchsiella alkaliacetigena]MCK8824417.1 M67 family metallopeptidase [Fuchsiella alkaliacetigena]
MIINLAKSSYEKLVEDAKERFPKEACGLVAGTKEEKVVEVKEVVPMTNLDDSAEHFTLDPQEQFKVAKEIRKQGYELLGNYHSHPFTPARPSAEDKKLAYNEELIYFIISLAESEPILKAFKIEEQELVSELELQIENN